MFNKKPSFYNFLRANPNSYFVVKFHGMELYFFLNRGVWMHSLSAVDGRTTFNCSDIPYGCSLFSALERLYGDSRYSFVTMPYADLVPLTRRD